MSALTGLLRKEAYHIRRDRRTLAVIIFMPVVQVVLFGRLNRQPRIAQLFFILSLALAVTIIASEGLVLAHR